jgi:putative beta-barrel porin BBP2
MSIRRTQEHCKRGGVDRRRSIRPGAAIWLVLFLWGGGLLRAEDPGLLPIRLGRVLFYPSIGLTYSYEDNVQRTNPEDPISPPVSSSVQEVRPTLRFEAPFKHSLVSLGYFAAHREYGDPRLENAAGTDHDFQLDGRFQATSSLRFDVKEHYLQGIAQRPENDLTFSVQPFTSNVAAAGFALELGPIQSLEAGTRRDYIHFDYTDSSGDNFTSRDNDSFARYLIATGPDNHFFLSLDWRNSTQTRAVILLEPADYSSRAVGVGFRRKAGPDMTSELRVSYAAVRTSGGSAGDSRGIVVEGEINGRLGATSAVTLKLRRGPQTSFFNTSAFYLNAMAEVGYQQDIGRQLRMLLGAGYQKNSYPEAVRVHASGADEADFPQDANGVLDAYSYLLPSDGVYRKDRVWLGSLKFVYRLGRPLDFEIGIRRNSVSSNITAGTCSKENNLWTCSGEYKIFDYHYQAVTASFVAGWQ